jgi:hypothetical protein
MSSQEHTNVADHFSESGDTESSVVTESTESEHSNQETDDFDTALLEYGRSILESVLDDTHDEDHLHENQIFHAKQKVRAQYDSAMNDLKLHLSISKEENIRLRDSNSRLEMEVLRLGEALKDEEGSLRRAHQMAAIECCKLEISREQEVERRKTLEAEMITLKQDRKRKAEQKAEMWERAEKRRAE